MQLELVPITLMPARRVLHSLQAILTITGLYAHTFLANYNFPSFYHSRRQGSEKLNFLEIDLIKNSKCTIKTSKTGRKSEIF